MIKAGRPPKIKKWQKTKENKPKMEYFAATEDIVYEKSLGYVLGLSIEVFISYVDPPGGMVHKAEVYIPFEGSLKWYMLDITKGLKEVGEPKFWRER